jgi:NAD(P)-dependent dehydrogenase (short-subunit alcohol dehydrogenase family)
MSESKVALVIGAGDATGGAVARRFAREGFYTCVTRRHGDKLAALVQQIEQAGGKARAFGSDARREDDVASLFDTIEREIGPIEVVSFNVGGNVRFPIRETTTRVYTKVWEMCALSGFLAGRAAAQVMVPRGRGTILSPAPPPAFAAVPATPPSPAANMPCAPWPKAWPVNSDRKASMSPT